MTDHDDRPQAPAPHNLRALKAQARARAAQPDSPSHAQILDELARARGYASWPALRAAALTTPAPGPAPARARQAPPRFEFIREGRGFRATGHLDRPDLIMLASNHSPTSLDVRGASLTPGAVQALHYLFLLGVDVRR